MTYLRNKASRCELAELKDGLIRDRIVCGVNKDTVRAKTVTPQRDRIESGNEDSYLQGSGNRFSTPQGLTEEKGVHVVK